MDVRKGMDGDYGVCGLNCVVGRWYNLIYGLFGCGCLEVTESGFSYGEMYFIL